ncbi:MAG: hypothetical protein AB1591_02035 [Pseudomonadota bacterium]
MKSRTAFIALVLSIACLTSAYMPVSPPPCPAGAGSASDFAAPESVVRNYLAAVDRGELLSFERRLERADINVVRVQYNYLIASGATETRVYSTLKEPMPVPERPEYMVIGVCSAMVDGSIVETESHVLLK